MKKVEKLKVGMEVWMKFRVGEGFLNMPFSIGTDGILFYVYEDCRLYKSTQPLEMFTIDENEIPELKGVEMEISDDGINWFKKKIFTRPIQKTFDLTNVPEHLLTDELKQYLR